MVSPGRCPRPCPETMREVWLSHSGHEKCDEEMSSCNATASCSIYIYASYHGGGDDDDEAVRLFTSRRRSRDNDRPSRRDVIEVLLLARVTEGPATPAHSALRIADILR